MQINIHSYTFTPPQKLAA